MISSRPDPLLLWHGQSWALLSTGGSQRVKPRTAALLRRLTPDSQRHLSAALPHEHCLLHRHLPLMFSLMLHASLRVENTDLHEVRSAGAGETAAARRGDTPYTVATARFDRGISNGGPDLQEPLPNSKLSTVGKSCLPSQRFC